MQCLREHTGELDFLCVKTVHGKCAEVEFSMMPGVSFHMHRQPKYRSSTRVGLVVPDMSKLMIPASGTASEVRTGDCPSHVDHCMPETDVHAARPCFPCVLICYCTYVQEQKLELPWNRSMSGSVASHAAFQVHPCTILQAPERFFEYQARCLLPHNETFRIHVHLAYEPTEFGLINNAACALLADLSWCEAADAQAKRLLSADIMCIEWEGLLPACSITDAITLCRDEVGRGACPWAAVYVWGFVDAPVSWLGTEHGCGPVMGGENDYIVLVLPNDQYVLFVSAGEGDGFAHFNTAS